MTSKRRLFRNGVVAALTAAALVAAVGIGASGAVPHVPTSPPVPLFGTPMDAAASDAFAARTLALAPIPSGASSWTGSPPAPLQEPMSVGVSGLVDVDELFEMTPLAEPLSTYVLAHLPPGAKITTSGYGSGPNGSSAEFVVSLPTSGPNESLALLVYTTTPVGSEEVVRVDAEVVWVPNRPAGEDIPTPVTATLTGFRTVSAAFGAVGPVTVALDPQQSARLARLVNALPLGPESFCAEDAEVFSISFVVQNASGGSYQVTGSLCGRAVRLTVDGAARPLLSDAGCSLFDAVRALLPSSAAGSRGAGC